MRSERSLGVARAWTLTAMLVMFVALLAGCGGSSSSSGVSSGGQQARSSGSGSSADQVMQSPGSSAEQAASGEGGAGGAVAAPEEPGQGGPENGGGAGDFDRKVIKTANLGLRAQDVRDAATKAQEVASRFGGSVLNSRIRRGDGAISASLVLIVPAPEFEAALGEMRGLGEQVTTDSVKGRDVTEEFVDLESRERNLLAAEESLLKLYDEAESVEDSLSVQSELTKVRGEIEQVQGRIQYLEQRTASSRVSLHIEPAVGSTPVGSDWHPADTVAQAWNASLGVLQGLATAVISVVVFGWWLAPALVAVVVSFMWWRRSQGSSPDSASS